MTPILVRLSTKACGSSNLHHGGSLPRSQAFCLPVPSLMGWLHSDGNGCNMLCLGVAPLSQVLRVLGNADLQSRLMLHGCKAYAANVCMQMLCVPNLCSDTATTAEGFEAMDLQDQQRVPQLPHAAMQVGDEVLQRPLTSQEAETLAKGSQHELGWTALHQAAFDNHVEEVQSLPLTPRWKATISAQDKDGRTVLHVAARSGRHGVVEQLLQLLEGIAALCIQDMHGSTALHLAALHNQAETMQNLLCMPQARAAIGLRDKVGATALHRAAGSSHCKVMEQLVPHPEGIAALCSRKNRGETAPHLAASSGECEWVEPVLQHSEGIAALCSQNSDGDTVLHLPTSWVHPDLLQQLLQSPKGMAALCSQDKPRETALHHAAYNKNVDTVHSEIL